MKTLQSVIMRRVYYAYALRLLTSVLLWQGVVMVLSLYLFGRLTHVASIISNFGATPVSNAPHFVVGAFMHALEEGKILTVLVALLVGTVMVKFLLQLVSLLTKSTLQPKQI